jgi:hypothetical protein
MNSIKSILLVALAMLSINSFGQSPEKINYQAIIRDVTGTVIQNQSVSIKIEILESTPSGTPAYEESHNVVTNNYGLVNLKIGTGAVISGVFSAINWGANPYFLKISVDPAGGSNYTLVGVSELVSVPYALHAKTVDNTDDADADPTNEIQTVTLVGTDVTLSNGGGTFTINDADSDPANEIQTVSQSGNLVTLSNGGGTLNVNDSDSDPTNEYNSSANLTGTNLSIVDGGGIISVDMSSLQDGVNDADADPTNEYITGANLIGTNLNIIDGGGTTTVDMSSLVGGGDPSSTNELNSSANLTGTNLNIIDAGGTLTVDMSSLQDGVNDADADPTNELNTSANLTGTNLNIVDAGGTLTVDMSSLQDGVNDADADPTNEYNSSANLTGTNLNIIDAGGTITVDMSSLQDGVNDADADPTNELQTLSITGDQLSISSGNTITIPTQTLFVGMHYQGGIIVFVDSSGLHGLIVAENDIVGTYAFQPSGNSNVTAAQSYYDGQANTTALVPVMGASSAAGQCDSYVVGGFSDWFLPSQAEIQLVFQNAYVVGNLDLGAIYWTSTQTPGGFGFSAVSYYGTGSANGSTNPGTAYSVRAMRAF